MMADEDTATIASSTDQKEDSEMDRGADVREVDSDRKCVITLRIATAIWLFWGVGIGVASWWTWTQSSALTAVSDEYPFLLVAATNGALGGLLMSVLHIRGFIHERWTEKQKGNSVSWSPINNLLLKPLFDPLIGSAFGVLAAELFLDSGTGLLKIALFGLVGGLLWEHVLRKLPELFNLTGRSNELR